MVPLKLALHVEPQQLAPLSVAEAGFLNNLRFVAMECRAKPRANLFEACALLQSTRDASRAAHAEALMRCLQEALGKPARLHSPGSEEMTFDEKWLLQLGQATVAQDEASISFLLASRVSAEHRRLVRFLVARIADSFYLN
jgi:hypothetical protein